MPALCARGRFHSFCFDSLPNNSSVQFGAPRLLFLPLLKTVSEVTNHFKMNFLSANNVIFLCPRKVDLHQSQRTKILHFLLRHLNIKGIL